MSILCGDPLCLKCYLAADEGDPLDDEQPFRQADTATPAGLEEALDAKSVVREVFTNEKGKKDFDGIIDGQGYKRSFDDTAKPPLDLISPYLLEGIARVMGKGAIKYARGNWMRGMSWSGVIGAIERHVQEIKKGHDVDENGELAVFNLACEVMFLAHFMASERKAEYKRYDDRLFGKEDPRRQGPRDHS